MPLAPATDRRIACRAAWRALRFTPLHGTEPMFAKCMGSLFLARGEYAKADPYYRDALVMVRALYPKLTAAPRGSLFLAQRELLFHSLFF
jgi:hypothetical protein